MIPTSSTSWTITLDDNPPVRVVDFTSGPGTRDVTVARWPFGPGRMPPAPRSYPAPRAHHALADGEGVLAVCRGLLDELAAAGPGRVRLSDSP